MGLFEKLPSPITPPESWVVPATLDPAKGREAVDHAVRDGFLRPFDIKSADIDGASLLYVPFWRIDVTVDGFHIGLSSTTTSNGRTIPIPTGGARHKDAVLMVCGRTLFPYEAKLPSLFGKVSGTPPLEVETHELVARASAKDALASAEIVDADVDRAKAESIAVGMLLRAVSPTHAIYQKYEPQIRAASFVLYPLYFARYRYEGEARRHAGEDFFVAVSARTGKIVADRHPSVARAVAAKVRRFLSFDRR